MPATTGLYDIGYGDGYHGGDVPPVDGWLTAFLQEEGTPLQFLAHHRAEYLNGLHAGQMDRGAEERLVAERHVGELVG